MSDLFAGKSPRNLLEILAKTGLISINEMSL